LALVAVVSGLATGVGSTTPAGSAPRATMSLTQAVRPATGSMVALNLDQVEVQIALTAKELRVASSRHEQFDRDLRFASRVTSELRDETSVLGQATLKNVIEGYRDSEVPRGSLFGVDDLTTNMRAAALGGAAVSSETEKFDVYRESKKDLDIEESILLLRQERAAEADQEVTRLQDQLNEELAVFGDLEERRLQDLAATVTVQASNRARARGRKQGFYLDTCPVNGPHSFIDSWGFARSGGRRHKGVDMLASRGVELVAPVSGRVEHFDNAVGGRSYRLYGDDGNYFYGTHMSAFGKKGQVNAGEVIGYNGDDGNAAGIPHLHFEIHPGGRGNPINPFIDTAAVCSGAQY